MAIIIVLTANVAEASILVELWTVSDDVNQGIPKIWDSGFLGLQHLGVPRPILRAEPEWVPQAHIPSAGKCIRMPTSFIIRV